MGDFGMAFRDHSQLTEYVSDLLAAYSGNSLIQNSTFNSICYF